MAPNPSNYVRPPTDAEWEKARPEFLKLYQKENLPLPRVMALMEEKLDFKARYVALRSLRVHILTRM